MHEFLEVQDIRYEQAVIQFRAMLFLPEPGISIIAMCCLAQRVLVLLLCNFISALPVTEWCLQGQSSRQQIFWMDANEGGNEDANADFMAGERAAALKRHVAATVLLSAKEDGHVLSGSAT